MERRDLKAEKGKRVTKVLNRKPYMKPKLTEYGYIEKLTQSGTGQYSDGTGRLRRIGGP